MSNCTRFSVLPLQYLASLDIAEKRRTHPNVPEHCRVKTGFNVKDANTLTKAIKQCLKLYGYYMTRVQSQGQWNQAYGRSTHSTTRRGTANSHALVNGQNICIEIKWQRDRLNEDQKKTVHQVGVAGGIYLVVKDYDRF